MKLKLLAAFAALTLSAPFMVMPNGGMVYEHVACAGGWGNCSHMSCSCSPANPQSCGYDCTCDCNQLDCAGSEGGPGLYQGFYTSDGKFRSTDLAEIEALEAARR